MLVPSKLQAEHVGKASNTQSSFNWLFLYLLRSMELATSTNVVRECRKQRASAPLFTELGEGSLAASLTHSDDVVQLFWDDILSVQAQGWKKELLFLPQLYNFEISEPQIFKAISPILNGKKKKISENLGLFLQADSLKMFIMQKFLKMPDKCQLKVDAEMGRRFLLDVEFPTYVIKARLCIRKREHSLYVHICLICLLFLPSIKLQSLPHI